MGVGRVEGMLARVRALYKYIHTIRDPFMAAVFLEDLAACGGVLVAATGIGLSAVTGNPLWDSLASIAIGGMLGGVAVRLVTMNQRYLLGHAVDDDTVTAIERIIMGRPSIDSVRDVQTQWFGPATFGFKAEVDFDGTYLAARLQDSYEKLFLESPDLSKDLPLLLAFYAEDVTRLVERELQDIESRIRAVYPEAAFIELEPDSDHTELPMFEYVVDKHIRSHEHRNLMIHLTQILARKRAKDPDNPALASAEARARHWFQQAEGSAAAAALKGVPFSDIPVVLEAEAAAVRGAVQEDADAGQDEDDLVVDVDIPPRSWGGGRGGASGNNNNNG
jgi:zinc transporter 9